MATERRPAPGDHRELIHKRIDGSLNSHETKIFEKEVLSEKTEYEALKRVHETTLILRKKTQVPANFSKKVIEEIRRRPLPPGKK
jgi:hypothetical protein